VSITWMIISLSSVLDHQTSGSGSVHFWEDPIDVDSSFVVNNPFFIALSWLWFVLLDGEL